MCTGHTLVEPTPRVPYPCGDRRVTGPSSGLINPKPSTEFFVHDSLNVLWITCLRQPRDDGSSLWFVLIGIAFKIDAHGVEFKQDRSDGREQCTPLLLEGRSLSLDDFSLGSHRGPIFKMNEIASLRCGRD